MKCPNCGGTGKVEVESGIFTIHGCDCVVCYGTGVVEPLTNEEWLRSCNTEQLAEFMQTYTHDIIFDWKGLNNPFLSPFPFKNVIGNKCTTKDGWVEWLKQPHTEKE